LPDKPTFRIDELAVHFGVSQRSIRRWITAGRLVAFRFPDGLRIPKDSALNFQPSRRRRQAN
jgi:excisionase family DNA binding protein